VLRGPASISCLIARSLLAGRGTIEGGGFFACVADYVGKFYIFDLRLVESHFTGAAVICNLLKVF